MQSWKMVKSIGLYCSSKVCLIHALLLAEKLFSSRWHQYGVFQGVVHEQCHHFRWDLLAVPWRPAAVGAPWGDRTEPVARAVPPHKLGNKTAALKAKRYISEGRRGFGHCLLAGHLKGHGTRATQSSYELVPGPSSQCFQALTWEAWCFQALAWNTRGVKHLGPVVPPYSRNSGISYLSSDFL